MKKDLSSIIAFIVIVFGVLSFVMLINMKWKRDQYNAILQAEQEQLNQLGQTYQYPYTRVYWEIEAQYDHDAIGY